MAIGVAKNILYAAMTTPNSEDIPDEPVIPSEHTLTVSYPTTVKLSIDGEEQTIANLIGAYKDVVMANTNLDLTFEPVSYTHLDVYKRQSSHSEPRTPFAVTD